VTHARALDAPCKRCGRPMHARARAGRASEAPAVVGSVPHSARGYCTTCYASARFAGDFTVESAAAPRTPSPRRSAAVAAGRVANLEAELRGSWLLTRPVLDVDTLHSARLVVCARALDVDDARDLLDVLGLSYDAPLPTAAREAAA
jgi:hypothetical protein